MQNEAVKTPDRYQINKTAFSHYWQWGAGKQLLKQLGYTPDISNAEKFKPYLFAFDEEGDQLAALLFNKAGFQQTLGLLQQYTRGQTVAADYKTILNAFFKQVEPRPTWLDLDKIETGAALCRRTGIPGLLVLRNYCLMGGYESAAINKPLIYTGALKKGAAKRLGDTTAFWVGVTRAGAFNSGGEGIYHVLSTRIIHSFSRINILRHTNWNSNHWGTPLNTWDMQATQLGFSLVFLTGLRRMGFQPSEEEVDGLFHLWKYIGYLLGIPLQLLPDTETAAIEALYYWTMTQSGTDEDSISLAKALVAETIHSGFPKWFVMRLIMQQIHLFYNHYFLGEYSCRLLQIPKVRAGNFVRFFLWKLRIQEKKMGLQAVREKAIVVGGAQQAEALAVYMKFRSNQEKTS